MTAEHVEERLAQLGQAFADELKGLRIWSRTWAAIYAAGAVLQLVIALALRSDDPVRTFLFLGAAGATFGSASFFILPLRISRPLGRVKWADPDRSRLLDEAEATCTRVAKTVRQGRSWVGHFGNLVGNVSVTLTMGLWLHTWKAALIGGSIGIVIGELNLLTKPGRLDTLTPQKR